MAVLPGFVFPSAKEFEVCNSATINRKEKPLIQLNTSTEAREGYRLAIPGRRYSRPANLRTTSTPPESPTRTRASTMDAQGYFKMHGSGAITPPVTPTNTAHSKSNSASSDFLSTLSSLRRGDSTSSRTGRLSLDELVRPGSTELLVFPHHLTDYDIQVDAEGKKRPIGFGAWSNVYLAKPSLPHPADRPASDMPIEPVLTPPITPVQSGESSTRNTRLPSIPPLYAIKVPGSTSAKKVLDTEARILSYLSRFPDADGHIVPFFGQDKRTGALVLRAMDGTLEHWTQKNLNTLDGPSRAQKLTAIFPTIALSLIDSLIWMQDKNCIHADVKPSNILTSPSSPALHTPYLVFSDFSSTILTTLSSTDTTPPPMGAGTWEFLDPSLLSSSNPATPCAATDLWSLGITLLFLILGASPFEAFKHNKFQQREMIKSGAPLQCLRYDDQGIKNMRILKALSADLGFDVQKWFGKVLVKNKEKRVSVTEWRVELINAMAQPIARI